MTPMQRTFWAVSIIGLSLCGFLLLNGFESAVWGGVIILVYFGHCSKLTDFGAT
jgi:formate hydrogenlyase subunit 3/multisubunit Na+/H+ antiporter MnhD subunit